MKNLRKIIFLLTVSAILLSLGVCTSFAADAKLSAIYFTPMTVVAPVNGQTADIEKLSDGKYGNNNAIAFNKPKADPFTDNEYIDVYFSYSTVSSLTVATGLNYGNQQISNIKVDYWDNSTKAFVPLIGDTLLPYVNITGSQYDATVAFSTPVSTSALRVYITGAPRTWNNFRIDELTVFGTAATGRLENGNLLYNDVDISVKSTMATDVSGNRTFKENIADGSLFNAGISDKSVVAPTAENPYQLTFDFKGKFYTVDSFEMISRFETTAEGILAADFQYYTNGGWKTAKHVDFTRTCLSAEWDKIALDASVMSSKFRLSITSANTTWGVLRLGEFILNGSEYTAEKITSEMEITAADSQKNGAILNDGDSAVALSGSISDNDSYEFYLKNATAQITSINFTSADSSLTDVRIEYFSDGAWKTVSEGSTISYDGTVGTVAFGGSIKTQKIRITPVSAVNDTYSLSEVEFYGLATSPTGTRLSGIYTSAAHLVAEDKVYNKPFNRLNTLYDAKFGDSNCLVILKDSEAEFNENEDYIEMFLNQKSNADSLYIACRGASNFSNQCVSKIRIDYFDDVTGAYKTLTDNYDITYSQRADTNYEAKIVFDDPIFTARIKVYLLDGPKVWDNLRLDELYAMGTVGSGKENNGNLLYNVQSVTLSSNFNGLNPANIYDGVYSSNVLTGNVTASLPSEENPYTIDFNFGSKYYELSQVEIIDMYFAQCINKGYIQYYSGDNYITASSFDLGRNPAYNNNNVNNGAYGKITVAAKPKSNKFRIVITEAVTAWSNFRINEIIFSGREVSSEETMNAGGNAIVYTNLASEDDTANITDINVQTSYNTEISESGIIELYYSQKAIDVSSVEVCSSDSSVTGIKAEAFVGGSWESFGENSALTYTDGKATLSGSATNTNRMKFTVYGSGTVKIDDIRIIGNVRAFTERIIGTANYAPNATITTNIDGFAVANLNDGDAETVAEAATVPENAYLEFKMSGYLGLDKIAFKNTADSFIYDLQYKNDDSEWIDLFTNCISNDGYVLPARITTNEYRIVIKDASALSIGEVEFYGICNGKFAGKIEITGVIRADETTSISIKLSDIDIKSLSGDIIAAVYTADGSQLIGTALQKMTVTGNSVATLTLSPAVSISEEILVKAFWLSDVKPLGIAAVQ